MSSTTRFSEFLKLQHCSNGAFQLATAYAQWTVQKEQIERSRTLSQALEYADNRDAELQVPEGYAAAWVEVLQLHAKERSIPTASLPRCSQVRVFTICNMTKV